MKKVVSAVVAFVMCVMVIGSVNAAPGGKERAAYREEVKMNTFRDLGEFSPYKVNDDVEYEAVRYLFDSLYYIDENGRAKEMLGYGLSISDDNMEYSIKLKGDLKWHDGSSVTVEDVVFTFENAKNVDWYKGCVRALDKVSSSGDTVSFHLKYPNPVFMKEAVTYIPIVPKNYYEKGEYVSIGSGAYRLSEIMPGKRYVLDKTEYYLTDVNAGRIVIDVLSGEEDCVNSIIRGEYWSTFGSLSPAAFSLYNKDINDVINMYGTASQMLFLNNEWAQFGDVNLRKAISMAIDYGRIVNEVYLGRAEQGSPGFFTIGSGYAHKDLDYYTNADEAKQKLLSAGFVYDGGALKDKDGNTVALKLLASGDTGSRLAEIVKENLFSIGINTEVELVDENTLAARIKSGEYQGAVTLLNSYYQYCESNLNLLLDDGYANYGRYKLQQSVEEALNKYTQAMDAYERYDRLMELQAAIGEEAPFIALCYPRSLNAYEKGIYNTYAYKDGVGIYSVLSFITNKKSIAADSNSGVLTGPETGSMNKFAVGAVVVAMIAAGFGVWYGLKRFKDKDD